MYGTSGLAAFAATISAASAAFQGFNYGSTFTTGAPKQQSDFEAEFKNAQGLVGAPAGGFTSARLYTMVQAGTSNSPISAIPAGISTGTSLLLTLWASGGDAVFANELQALNEAIATYGDSLGAITAGISVGSEDLYRISPTGLTSSGGNPGVGPDVLTGYIAQVRSAISGTALANAPVGHVDTWTAWVNGSNQAVIDNSDWLGTDAYPYFQNTMANSIDDSQSLFVSALDQTQAAAGGKPVWVTETGFPVSGDTQNLAVPSIANAKTYWDVVGCPLFGVTNTWWYTMQDAEPATPNPSFGIIGSTLTTTPLFDISCANTTTSSSSSSSSSSAAIQPSTSSSAAVSSSAGTGTGTTTASATIVGTTVSASESASVSATASSASASTSASVSLVTTVPSVLGGGSPGGVATSQLSLETSTLTSTASKATGSAVSGAGSGSGSGSGSGTGGNTTLSTSGTPTPTTVPTVNAGATTGSVKGSIGAAFAALMIAILAL